MPTETHSERRPPEGTAASIHVLVVDDDTHLLGLSSRLLDREEGFRVSTAENALDACRTVREERVDCVVSDYRMPAVDGLDLLEGIRESRTVPFVMFTNKGSAELEARVTELADTAYLQKGLDIEQYERLAATVRSLVEDERRGTGGEGAYP